MNTKKQYEQKRMNKQGNYDNMKNEQNEHGDNEKKIEINMEKNINFHNQQGLQNFQTL